MRTHSFRRYFLFSFAVLAAGCARQAQQAPPAAPATAPSSKPTGRLVPAVVASFERGGGGWQATAGTNRHTVQLREGDASRGKKWLAVPGVSGDVAETNLSVFTAVSPVDWTRFGDTLRADVRATPNPTGGSKVSARLFTVDSSGKEASGPETPVTDKWQTLAWQAGPALNGVARLGVRFRYAGQAPVTLGVDNVRVGAAEALSAAYSVVYGPFPAKDAAVAAMPALKAQKVDSFPIYEQGWYLNLGTFRSRSSAAKEAGRLTGLGLKVSVLER